VGLNETSDERTLQVVLISHLVLLLCRILKSGSMADSDASL
jgi:hypothetical protein